MIQPSKIKISKQGLISWKKYKRSSKYELMQNTFLKQFLEKRKKKKIIYKKRYKRRRLKYNNKQ